MPEPSPPLIGYIGSGTDLLPGVRVKIWTPIWGQHSTPIDSLNGRQLSAAARDARPGLRILFMTGYAADASRASGFLEPAMELITKPFVVTDLVSRLRAMLDGGQPTAG